MKQSRRAKRMERHHKRNKGTPTFNLVSLMDIFTILVFFLLVNSGEGEVLPSAKSVELPESVSEQKPEQNVVVIVTGKDILVQGTTVTTVAEIGNKNSDAIDSLRAALRAQKKSRIIETDRTAATAVTIMGTKQTPYHLLKQIMTTCTEVGYGRISLAVLQKQVQEG
jgi:biopolymer transport protein ExbD